VAAHHRHAQTSGRRVSAATIEPCQVIAVAISLASCWIPCNTANSAPESKYAGAPPRPSRPRASPIAPRPFQASRLTQPLNYRTHTNRQCSQPSWCPSRLYFNSVRPQHVRELWVVLQLTCFNGPQTCRYPIKNCQTIPAREARLIPDSIDVGMPITLHEAITYHDFDERRIKFFGAIKYCVRPTIAEPLLP
jgi:hypothetical protein